MDDTTEEAKAPLNPPIGLRGAAVFSPRISRNTVDITASGLSGTSPRSDTFGDREADFWTAYERIREKPPKKQFKPLNFPELTRKEARVLELCA